MTLSQNISQSLSLILRIDTALIDKDGIIANGIKHNIQNIEMSGEDIIAEIKEMIEDNELSIERLFGKELTNEIKNY